MNKKVHYKVKEVTTTVYKISRFENEVHEDGRCSGGGGSIGSFETAGDANRVAAILAEQEEGATVECFSSVAEAA